MKQAFICDSVRTPIGRYGGALSSVRADDLAAHPIRQLLARNPALDWERLDEVILGCANQCGEDSRNVARMALLLAGLPETVPGVTLNRLCGSGMDAVVYAARSIRSGEMDLALAGGVESMSRAPFVVAKSERAFHRGVEMFDTTIGWRFVNGAMKELYGVDSMGETAENVAEAFGVSREDQDAFAYRSQHRAAGAVAAGRREMEIVPIEVRRPDGISISVGGDEHPRSGITLEELAGLRPAFRAEGTVTAGNASGINDGAVALVMASENAVDSYGLIPKARMVSAATAGVAPRLMGMGPVPATRKALAAAGLTIDQMDVIEINEAFAAQALAVLRELLLCDDAPHVNPNGGAIALGHPLGMTGARLIQTAAHELSRTNGRYALCTMCIGVGQGIAVVLEGS